MTDNDLVNKSKIWFFKEKRSALRLLSWEVGNLGRDFCNHEIGAHVFGGASSPGCCSYALWKMTMENEARYGEETSQPLRGWSP